MTIRKSHSMNLDVGVGADFIDSFWYWELSGYSADPFFSGIADFEFQDAAVFIDRLFIVPKALGGGTITTPAGVVRKITEVVLHELLHLCGCTEGESAIGTEMIGRR